MQHNSTSPIKNIDNHADSASIRQLQVFVVGCGIVGGSLIDQIAEQQAKLLANHDIKMSVHGIANSRHFVLSPDGLDLSSWQQQLPNADGAFCVDRLLTFVQQQGFANPVMVDCTGSRSVAMGYEQCFEHGVHVVTANKIANGEPFAHYRRIRDVAFAHNKKFHYETNIGAGLPVIEPLQKLFKSGDELHKFEGILSGSLSYIFGELHKGLSLSEATLKAQQLGYTEPDPREDLNGMDVARKVLIVAREAGMNIDLSDIVVESVLPQSFETLQDTDEFWQQLPSIDQAFKQRVEQAEDNQQVLRYVASIEAGQCRVAIAAVDQNNPLHAIAEGENVLAIYSRYYQPKPLVIRGYGAGPVVTAAGVFSDVLRIID